MRMDWYYMDSNNDQSIVPLLNDPNHRQEQKEEVLKRN